MSGGKGRGRARNESGGRSESILLSMPPLVSWAYNRKTKKGTPEDRLYREFLVRKDWV